MFKIGNHYRQGDVLVAMIEDEITSEEKLSPEEGYVILARGEKTGHAHVLDPDKVDMYRQKLERCLKVKEPTDLKHIGLKGDRGDHKSIPVPAGNVLVIQQTEFKREFYRVSD